MSADDNGIDPSRDGFGDLGEDDRFTENGASEDVTNGPVWTLPHLLELELLDAGLVRGDCGTLDADLVFQDSVSGIDGNLVVGL